MPASARGKATIQIACQKWGNAKGEPRGAYSTRCKKCREHFRLEEVLHPTAPPAKSAIEHRQIVCFQCGATLEVAAAAESTMCKRCSSHVDLQDYPVSPTLSQTFPTYHLLFTQ